MPETLFRFKKFEVSQEKSAMKINTDGVLLGAWVNVDSRKNILDIGTGSGVIAMMLAQRAEEAKIVGVEIDGDSAEEAVNNMANCQWSDRLSVVHAPIQEYAEDTDEKFDLIVSNPPFFSGGTLSANQQRTMVKHTVKLAHNDLLRAVYKLLTKDGDFSLVLPNIEGLRFIEMAEQCRLYCNKMTEVSSFPDSQVERLLLNFRKKSEALMKEKLSIRKDAHHFSTMYKAITKDFYLKG